MSEQCLETIEATAQKAPDWIARISSDEMQKIMDAFSRDMQFLFPALASAA